MKTFCFKLYHSQHNNKLHRQISAAGVGDIYVYIVSDVSAQEIIGRTGKSVGYDFGLKKFLTASDGNDIVSPLFFARNQE